MTDPRRTDLDARLDALTIDLPDPAGAPFAAPDAAGAGGRIAALATATTARIGVGRAGPRYRTASQIRFQADHAVTQDALHREVDGALIEDLGLLVAQSRVTGGRGEYLLRPDLGRALGDAGRRLLRERCLTGADLQIAVGDGLSAAAVEANVPVLLPALLDGARAVGITTGTPFFIRNARVGVLNEIGELLRPAVALLLIGERPGLGRATSLSAYLAYRPKAGDTDADRDVISNIYAGGGLPPDAAAVAILDLARRMIEHRASGVRLRATLDGDGIAPAPPG